MNLKPEAIAFVNLAAQQALIRDRLNAAITAVLDHGQYIMGPEITALEGHLAAFTGARHALTCSSGTDALLIAMLALGIGPGDAILCPAFTYTATPESIALLGASPVFVDVDENTFNVTLPGLEAGLAAAKMAGLKAKGIIAVDLFGQPASYTEINAFAQANGLYVIADAAQSFGASVGGARVGTLAHVTATSFFPAKPLGCYGDGGAIFTDDNDLALVMDSIRLHGRATGGDKYDIARVGVNGRLDTLQAAILLEKLVIFEDEIVKRNAVADFYSRGLATFTRVPCVAPNVRSVWAQYTLRLPSAAVRTHVAAGLKADGIPTAVYYPRPLHHQTAYRHFPAQSGGLPISERLVDEVLSLPMHPYLRQDEQDRIINTIGRLL